MNARPPAQSSRETDRHQRALVGLEAGRARVPRALVQRAGCAAPRHLALWVIAISQQLSDFDNEYGSRLGRDCLMNGGRAWSMTEPAGLTDQDGMI